MRQDIALPQLGNVDAQSSSRRLAIAIGALFASVALAAAAFGHAPGPQVRAFLPICATLWCAAELLTAFFLCSQFYVAGRLSYALIASAYAFTGLLTIPYLYNFPGVFFDPPLPSGVLQVSVFLWFVWHVTFPTVIAITHLVDPTLEARIVPRAAIGRVLVAVVGGTAAVAVAIAGAVWSLRDALPRIVDASGHFSEVYSFVVAPIVVATNLAACAIVSRRLRTAKTLQVWVAVALLTSALDGLVNATSPARYTISWYVGKFEALAASTILLAMLLVEISTLYRRLFDVASIDALTGLSNRRSLDSEMHETLAALPRMADGVALLMIDLDLFKTFNDTHGHAGGDEVLRVVADVLRASATRPTDRVARYGGEEFVVMLADTTLDGARRVAERMRVGIANTPIALADGSFGTITASIGIAHATSDAALSERRLFADADRALYVAKGRGRNCVVVAEPHEAGAPLPIAVG